MTKSWLLGAWIAASLGCATTQSRQATPSSSPSSSPPASRAAELDGLSCAQRIHVRNIVEEYQWVQFHYPKAKVTMQALSKCDQSPVDELYFDTPDGKKVVAFFDISSFFGRGAE